jgi:hypothetical protein
MRPPLTVTLRANRSMPLTRNICNVRSSWLGADCTAIITNTPHNTDEACAIVRNLVALVEGQHVDLVAALFRTIWGAEPGRLAYFNRPSFFGKILCCWRPRWIAGTKRARCMLTRGTSGGRSHGAVRL